MKARGVVFDAAQAPPSSRSCAFTSVAQLADGSLLVAFRNATGRDSPDGRLRVMRRRDTGANWETLHAGLTATVDGVAGNLYSGYFTELSPERLLGLFLWVDRSDPTRSFVNAQTAGILPTRVLTAESSDGGENWEPFRPVDLSPHVGCASTGPILRLANGTLALPYESWKEYDDSSPGRHAANLRLSSDGGDTWGPVQTVASDLEGRILYWDQRFARHPETGMLVAMFWTHDRGTQRDLDVHISWGQPDGARWTTPVPTGWRGQHCQPIAMGGNRLVAVYVHRHHPPSLRAIVGDDFGRSWREDSELVFYGSSAGAEPGVDGPRDFEGLWQDMMAWRFGHPRGVLLPDGDLFVAYYAGDHHATSIHWIRFSQGRE